jgi:DNA-binding transcriptional regulator YiaG
MRQDSAPPHPNAIRRFREELRLGRQEFADLLGVNQNTLRVWEDGKSKPRGESCIRIIEAAERNEYPLSYEDIFPPTSIK